MRRESRVGGEKRFVFKFFPMSLVSVTIFSLLSIGITLVFSVDHYTSVIQNLENDYEAAIANLTYYHNTAIDNLTNHYEYVIANLTDQCSEKGVLEMESTIEILENELRHRDEKIVFLQGEKANLEQDKTQLGAQVAELTAKITGLEDDRDRLEREISGLNDRLRLFMITVNGFVNTTGWDRWFSWELPSWPVSITFDNGIKHIVPISDGTYRISLQNKQTYVVTVQWANALDAGSADAGILDLQVDEKTITADWDLSKP